jgi:hypothetical protein
MKIKKNNDAVSELIGSVLLLLIAVIVFVVIQANILSYPTPVQEPFVTIIGEIQGKNITLLHRGGEPLSLKTRVSFKIDENITNIIIGENNYLDSRFKEDGEWNIGERLIFNQESELNDIKVRVTVVDVNSNTVVMDETL